MTPSRHKAHTLYLHIGCEKTGTTTLQRLLARNRARLAAAGVLYPASIGQFNHFDLSIHCLDDSRLTPLRRMKGLDSPDKIDAYRAQVAEALAAEVANAGAHTIIVSSEQLSSNVHEEAEAERLIALLRTVADEIRLICYLRRQDEMCLSSYSTEIKAGSTRLFDPEGVSATAVKYNFRALIELWRSVLPPENLNIRLFDPRFLKDGDLVTDFAAETGLDAHSLDPVPRQNSSLDVYALELLRRMNQHLPKHGDPSQLRGNLQELLTSVSDGPKMRLTHEASSVIMAKFAASNEWVRKTCFLGLDFDPFGQPDESSLADTAAPEVTADHLAEYAARLWLAKQHQFLKEVRGKDTP